MRFWRMVRLLPPLAIGIAAAVWLVSTAAPPAQTDQREREAVARTVRAEAKPIAPVVRGYGTVHAAQSWQAVAEVAGAVTYRHPELESGNMIPEGTRVLEIDANRYETSLQEVQADLTALEAEGRQIAQEAENTRLILGIEQDRLALAESELARVRTLAEQGTVPQARLDEQTRATLALRRTVQELENTLALIPVRRARLDAQIARARAAQARAERDLRMTRIETPFDLRVGDVHVEQHQFVTAGQSLVSADGVAQAEIVAQMSLDSFPRLMGAAATDGVRFGARERDAILDRITAQVRLVSDPDQVWRGRLIRVENGLDPQARSVPVVIAVDAPYDGANPPARLPLVPNMYVEVTLTGPEGAPMIVLPAQAVHGGDTVYLRDAEGRLEMRDVIVAWTQAGESVISEGLDAGDEVILDDIVPALPGLRVRAAEPAE
ncbi:efflux transporter periplasmic adaptor subunit [Roseovarius sp. A46]|uniref:efflux RND transporter periplasmic adaptor subunit n=1 Tax=Roseovarius sp. A46 TaxID=2109331 RepID=UPI0013E9662B|nr:efflux transporter periplasmic adaptor subunit [Roseovarius sp. A46]